VTKAVVCHQYKSKNDIVIAVTENELAILEDALLAAEADTERDQARRTLLVQLVDVAVTRRKWMGTLTGDPVIVRILGDSKGSRAGSTASRSTSATTPRRGSRRRSCRPPSRVRS